MVVIVILSAIFGEFGGVLQCHFLLEVISLSVNVYCCWGENYGQLGFCSVMSSLCLIAYRMFFIFSVNVTFAAIYLSNIVFLDLVGNVVNVICLNHLFGS